MNTLCFRPLKDFSLYEINDKGDVRKITTKRPITCCKTKTGDRFYLHDSGKVLTISRSKLIYCYEHDTSPYELRGKCISNGELMSLSEHVSNLKTFNQTRIRDYRNDKEREDIIHTYEKNLRCLNLLYKLITQDLSRKESVELSKMILSSTRKALCRYYSDKGEYRKEEINDIVRDLFYGTFIDYCPFNIDAYIYRIIQRKLTHKKNKDDKD